MNLQSAERSFSLTLTRQLTSEAYKREVIQLKKLLIAIFLIVLSSSAVCLAASGVVRPGMSGENVRYIQELLSQAGYYSGEIDGVYGDGTGQAVTDFQASIGIEADGIVGEETLSCLERSAAETSRGDRVITMTATAYAPYDGGNSYTYRGHYLRKGLVAVDPNYIPLGTRLYIDGYGYAIADDIGGSIQGNIIDLAFDSRDEALQFGRRTVTVHVLD